MTGSQFDGPQGYLYRLEPVRPEMLSAGPTPFEATSIAAHVSYLAALARDGVVDLAGRTQTDDDTTFGIVILRADSEQAARAVMQDDPAVRDRVMRAELFPFAIAILGKDRFAGAPWTTQPDRSPP